MSEESNNDQELYKDGKEIICYHCSQAVEKAVKAIEEMDFFIKWAKDVLGI